MGPLHFPCVTSSHDYSIAVAVTCLTALITWHYLAITLSKTRAKLKMLVGTKYLILLHSCGIRFSGDRMSPLPRTNSSVQYTGSQ